MSWNENKYVCCWKGHFSLVKAAMNAPRNEFHLRRLNWLPTWQLKNKEALLNFKGLSEDGGRAKFAENLSASPLNKYLPNETTLSMIHLAGQYL